MEKRMTRPLPATPSLAAAAYSGLASAAGLAAPALSASPAVAAAAAGPIREERDHLLVGDRKVKVTYDAAFEGVARSVAAARDELERTRDQLRQQAHGWYRYSLIYGGVGFILIVAAVGALVFGLITTGIVATVASAIPDAAAALFFLQAKRADDRLDQFANSLGELREVFA